MKYVGVDDALIRTALQTANVDRVLPFRFITAAKYAPDLEDALEQLMFKCLEGSEKLSGKTILVVDNSGSMSAKVSGKSELSRADAAQALAMLVREVCEQAVIVSFADSPTLVAPRRGFALSEAIRRTPSGSTNTDDALAFAEHTGYDRIIVITDEQSHQRIRRPLTTKSYFINVASEQNGVGYGDWTHIDGWSEAVIDYIREYERKQ
jgi:Mg-chelatase subunit ChlD